MLTAPTVTPDPRTLVGHPPVAFDIAGTLDGRRITVSIKPDLIQIAADCNATDDVLLLRVSPQTAITEGHVRDAVTLDLTVGDDEFDKAFHVEAAPTATVRTMFDERVRTFMLAHPRCHLSLRDRALHFEIKHLSERELVAAISDVAHAAAQAEHAVRSTAADEARPTEHDDYRGSMPAPPAKYSAQDTALARVQPTTLAARQVRQLRELRSRGHFFGTTMVVTASAYVGAILAYGLPLLALILTPIVMFVGGIAVYFVLSVFTEITGIATYYRRQRVKNLDTSS